MINEESGLTSPLINEEVLVKIEKNQAVFVGGLKVLDAVVDIIAPFQIKKEGEDFNTYNIPESSISLEQEGQYRVKFQEGQETYLEWQAEHKTAILHGKGEDFRDTPAILFVALSVTEHIRQKDKKLLTHGACVELPNGESIVLLGNQGAGKTTLMYHLCKYYGCKIIANDQVILGLNGKEVETFGGTKNITIRQTATSGHLQDLESIFDKTETEEERDGESLTKWKTKANFTPEELGIEISQKKNTKVSGIFWLNLDVNNQDEYRVKKHQPTDLVESLLLSEKLSRHINGSATPIISRKGQIALSPSFDTMETLKNRQEIIDSIYGVGYYSVSGGDLPKILENILDICTITTKI